MKSGIFSNENFIKTSFLIIGIFVLLVNSPEIQKSFAEQLSVFQIGKQVTLYLFEPDLNLNSDKAEIISLSVLSFESDKIKINMGNSSARSAFDPHPSVLRETGDNTGIFYTVIEIPRSINGKIIHIGEEIEFKYIDSGAVASVFVGQNTQDSTITGNISNLGANIKFEGSKNVLKEEQNQISLNTLRPLQQVKSGILPEKVICKEGLELIFKFSTHSPVCVKPGTAEKLLKRGWI